jgi:hypothetical protein
MSYDLKVLKPENQDAILAYERERAKREIPDEMGRELASWKARWRSEQLQHYLTLGWSFGAFENGTLNGYILGQPLLFFRGLTQTLWIEHLSYNSIEIGEALIESAFKWAKDKHFQTMLVSDLPKDLQISRRMEPFKDLITEMTSSRMV